MTRLVTAPLSAKGHMTLPKAVRKALQMALITNMQLVPAEESCAQAERRKLATLTKEPGGQTFSSVA